MQYANGIFVDDDGYSNFSLRGKKYHARKRADEEARQKAGAYDVILKDKEEQDKKDAEAKAKAELDAKIQEEAQKLVADKLASMQPPKTKSNKLPLIIGGVAVIGIVTFLLIKKLNK
jgi:hypothetical protein